MNVPRSMLLLAAMLSWTPCVMGAPDQKVLDEVNAAAPERAKAKPADAEKVDAAIPAQATAKPKKARKVLVWVRPIGFVHSSIGLGAYTVVEMGKKTGAYEAVVSGDLASLAPESLKQFDAVILCNTTGSWITPRGEDVAKLSSLGKDKNEIEQALRKGLLEFVNNGGGLAGFHSSTDANYHWPEYGRAIGGWFDGHPWHQKVTVKLVDPSSPLLAAFGGKSFEVTDEIYQFRAPYERSNLHELLALDTTKVDTKRNGVHRKDGDFAVAWIRQQGKGRVFYSSLGHREEIYWNPAVMKFYLDGFQYVLGDLEADATPGK